MANDINVKIKNWYKKKYPKDELGEGLNNTNTFKDLENALNKGGDVYKVMGEDDSVIRERLFQQLAKVKADLADKIDDVFDDDLQKEIVDALNKSIDIPFINEKMEAKGLNFLYDVFEEKIKDAFKKAL